MTTNLWNYCKYGIHIRENMTTEFRDNSKYIWEPVTRYKQLCDRIQDRWNTTSVKKLFYRVQYGGFGNQMYTITSMLLLGILSDHEPIYDYPKYSHIFGGCYSANIMSMDQDIGKTTRCNPYTHCFSNKDKVWTAKPVMNASVVFGASLMDPSKFLVGTENQLKFAALFKDIIPDYSPWNVRRDVMRLWLNPCDSLREEIQNEKKVLINRTHLIGLNLRMGGRVADFVEEYIGIPFSRLYDVAKQIHRYIESHNYNASDVTVYIASDSTKAIRRMSELLNKDLIVVESQLYSHGHTRRSRSPDDYVRKMKKVVADMYYMALSEHKFVSWQSSFGRIICFLSDENTCDAVLDWKNTNKKVRIPS